MVSPWSVIPFVLLLLAIAVLPLAHEKWWHHNRNKAFVTLVLALPVIGYVWYLHEYEHQEAALETLGDVALEYVDFIVLLGALFCVAGGVAVQGQFRPTPFINTGVLILGAVLANFIGTTGASILLIRPMLRINLVRKNRSHLPIFFIFVVSNLGGLLTPLGDPPLLLGFLRGVDFFWTFENLWQHWLVVNGLVILIAFAWDVVAYWREPDRSAFPPRHGSFVIGGPINLIFLAGILAAVLLQSEVIAGEFKLTRPWPNFIMLAMGILSLLCTRRSVREHNNFAWGPIIEVAVLFAGIFATMIPALALLMHHRGDFGISEPWQFFWLTGALSSWLDNAPTYVAFATLAAGSKHYAELSLQKPHLLQAISAGAVFMGAMTYIGNGPNFMVKSLAEHMGYRMPSFFGYLLYSTLILLPVFGLATLLFFMA
ncbi:MAG: sodium:proton antiporter [Planctomycetes bacterium]|nr:sodium:proton antiporter [Planctomycetota bacterium]